MANNEKLGGIIGLFVLIILGITFFTSISESVYERTNTAAVANETIDISSARTLDNQINNLTPFTTSEDDWISIIEVRNNSADALVLNTDYYVIDNATTEQIYFLNSTAMEDWITDDNLTQVEYSFYPDEYVKHVVARTFLNLVPLFYVISIFLFIVAIVYLKFLKPEGLI